MMSLSANKNVPDIPVIIVAFNRPEALKRILFSLVRADYPVPADLIISVDGGGDEKVKEIAGNFKWAYGEKKIILRETNCGLRNHIISCGDLSLDHDGAIILEDDLFVSPVFYYYTLQAFEFYKSCPQIGGFSLYAHNYNETAQFPFVQLSDDSDTYFLQYASSWGQFYCREHWAEFKKWYGINKDTKLNEQKGLPPNIAAWPDSSWKKYFVQYLIDSGRFFVFPRISLTTNFGDAGIHMKVDEKFLQIPLQYVKKDFRFKQIENSNIVYDAFCEILPPKLKNLVPELKSYNFATDLYGMRNLSLVKENMILTTKKCDYPVFSFGREMLPLESNIINAIRGDEISLAYVKSCQDPPFSVKLHKCFNKAELSYHYSLRRFHFMDSKIIIEEGITRKEETIRNLLVRLYTRIINKIKVKIIGFLTTVHLKLLTNQTKK